MSIKENILKPAWELIHDDTSIKKMYFLPWLLSIIFLTILLVYQSIYTYVVILDKKEAALSKILQFFHSWYVVEVIIFISIFIIIYLLIIPIFEWGLLKYIHKKDTTWKALCWESITVWFYKFFQLFKYSNLFSEFKFISIVNWYLFIIRFFEWKFIKEISYIFLILLFISIIINILFIYSKYIIVLENKWLFESISKSMRLTILNILTTIKLYLFMFVLNIRVIINFLVFLAFPIIISITITLWLSQLFLTIALIILSIIFILFILLLWYVTWVLEVFKSSIWYYAYKKSNEKLKNIENDIKTD